MANLIFWRHAEAEIHSKSGADCDRALTKRGHKDAIKMAKWLSQHLPSNTFVLCSPAIRCLQTVAALQALSSIHVEVADYLSVDSTPEIIASKVNNNDINQTILIIGHQPNLGALITKLLGMNEDACAVKKGAVWWLRQRMNEGVLQTYLYTVKHPNL
ncbi:MAG: histidine phosphatase family protein [Methylotenera sp.]|uniref:SixA phosphatase family protein n=1 Tax=Methylotenera sp. TaxID=2051956 RepID=UPI0024877875|nr:histidine phosphatase family protein [Methylotenera sp.]MDI1308347.1 histidine phosphatase family protein [Methylotenera sp.]